MYAIRSYYVIELANNIHQKHLIHNLGVVVNDIQLQGYYGYSYRYGYGYGYNYSYGYRAAYYEEDEEQMNLLKWLREKLRL